MDTKKLQQIVGPEAQKIKKKKLKVAAGSFRPLAMLLLEWYEQKVAEEEIKKYDENK